MNLTFLGDSILIGESGTLKMLGLFIIVTFSIFFYKFDLLLSLPGNNTILLASTFIYG